MSFTNNRGIIIALVGSLFALGTASCKSNDKGSDGYASKEAETVSDSLSGSPEVSVNAQAPKGAPMADEAEEVEQSVSAPSRSAGSVGGIDQGADKKSDGVASGKVGGGGPGAAEQGPAPRAWFPETFLFRPLIVTDDEGHAEVTMPVPDRLTTWRILGLAHSRNGAQAGATATFEGSLPAYVDPVVPDFLRVGDSVRLPILLVNNSDAALQTALTLQVEGGNLSTKTQAISIPANSSTLRYADVQADKIGTLRLMARMGEQDMVVRTINVLPTGRPTKQRRSGTLAAPRTLLIKGTQTQQSSPSSVRLSVYPGALALLRSELGASVTRGGMAADAFALLLAGQAPALLRALGDTPDDKALRSLKITATQNVIQHARVLNLDSAILIAEAARAHEGDPVLERLAARALATIESAQSPDGTCGGQDGITLQQLLVQTADCARAAQGAPNVTIRAGGAFERHANEIADPYTAAAVLAAHGASGALAQRLRVLVLDAIEDRDNGAKVLVVPPGVRRADGQAPTQVEATALAILALQDYPDAPLADLGATILASYASSAGWGDGRTNLVCMEAALLLFRDPLPESIAITLKQDGELIAEGSLSRDKVREVLTLSADGLDLSGNHTWLIQATPAVPGLGFSLEFTSWVPWTAEGTLGTELVINLPKTMSVGKAAPIGVQATAPSGTPFAIEMQLPAGALVDSHALDRLVQANSLSHYELVDGRVTMHVRGLGAGQRFSAAVPIIPTLAGRLQSGPSAIEIRGQRRHLPPSTWLIR